MTNLDEVSRCIVRISEKHFKKLEIRISKNFLILTTELNGKPREIRYGLNMSNGIFLKHENIKNGFKSYINATLIIAKREMENNYDLIAYPSIEIAVDHFRDGVRYTG